MNLHPPNCWLSYHMVADYCVIWCTTRSSTHFCMSTTRSIWIRPRGGNFWFICNQSTGIWARGK